MPSLRSTDIGTREPRRYEALDRALERGLLPDALLRLGGRRVQFPRPARVD